MNRGLKTLLFAAVLAGVLMAANRADAWCGWRGYYATPYVGWTGYSYGYYGGWGGYWGPSYAAYAPAYGYSCYTPRCYRGCGLLGRWRSHHYGYYCDACNPCYVSSCYACGCNDCCCGSGGAVIEYGTPSINSSPVPAEPPADQSIQLPEQQTSHARNSAYLTVKVPSDARVLVNGNVTRSKGELRRYVSRNLTPGFDYTYQVQAEMMVNGKPVTETRTVQLRVGQQTQLAFDMRANDPIETSLTLRVPADAQVYLAGNRTKGTGNVRTFRTTKLSEGQAWSDYVVRVVVNENGLNRTKEEKISLQAGDQRELSFDFDIDKVASVR